MTEFWTTLFGGSVMVCILEGVREALRWRRERMAKKEDREEEKKERDGERDKERIDKLETKVDALVESEKYVLYDRIRYLGQGYLSKGKIDFDDRRILNDMHHVYHDKLGGNGDLNVLMDAVNGLPLITY